MRHLRETLWNVRLNSQPHTVLSGDPLVRANKTQKLLKFKALR